MTKKLWTPRTPFSPFQPLPCGLQGKGAVGPAVYISKEEVAQAIDALNGWPGCHGGLMLEMAGKRGKIEVAGGWNGAGWSRTIAVMNRNSVIVGAVHCNHEVGFLFFTIEWPCWSMHHSNLPSTPWKWCARTMFMPKHSVMLWSISTRPLCHVDSMNTQLDSLNNGHTHQSGLVITRTYHGSNTNLWATWQPTKVVNPWRCHPSGCLGRFPAVMGRCQCWQLSSKIMPQVKMDLNNPKCSIWWDYQPKI